MPLLISSEPFTDRVESIQAFLDNNPHFKAESEKLKAIVPHKIPQKGLLYVNQREYAVVSPKDAQIQIIGSDDATTCHIVIIRHSDTGVTGLAHCDGCDTEKGLKSMVGLINTLSEAGRNGRLEVTLVGGFIDDRNESEKLSLEILGILQNMSEDLHLVGACITGNNTTERNNVRFPVIYGVAVDIKDGDIYPATFLEKGPEIDVRSACHFGGVTDLINIYDNENHHLVIGPYSWHPSDNAEMWLTVPDIVIRKYLSTSPEQEPAYFESHVRAALKVLVSHPKPSRTLFPGGRSHRYKMNEDGIWVKVTELE